MELALNDNDQSSHKICLITGMHRSGTSAIARMVQTFNFSFGDNLMAPGRDNPSGFFEDLAITDLNDSILRHFNLSWSSEESISPQNFLTMPEKFGEKAVSIFRDRLSTYSHFAVKDPRLSRLMPFWQSILVPFNIPIYVVIVIRHPLSIAASLFTRDKFDLRKSLSLWRSHMMEASQFMHPAWKRLILNYDLVMAEDAKDLKQFERLGEFLGEYTSFSDLVSFKKFLQKSLQHSQFNPDLDRLELQGKDSTLWRSLLNLSRDIENV